MTIIVITARVHTTLQTIKCTRLDKSSNKTSNITHTDTLYTYSDNIQNQKGKGATYGHIYCTTFKKKHSK